MKNLKYGAIAFFVGVFLLILVPLSMIGNLGGGSDAVPPPVEEEGCDKYQYTAYKLGIDWESVLLLDTFTVQIEKLKSIDEINYMQTALNFVQLKEDVYTKETDEETGEISWIFDTTNYYTGASQILNYLGIDETIKDIDVVISAVSGKESDRYRYGWEIDRDYSQVIDTYYPLLQDSKKDIQELLEAHYFAEMYGNIYTSAGAGGGDDIFLGDLIFAENGMEIPLYYQYQSPWGRIAFGGGNIASSGCSITSLGMVYTYLLDRTVTPAELASWAGNKYYVAPAGQSWSIFPDSAKAYGIKCRNLGKDSQAVANALSSGAPVISSMAPGTFTRAGHFIVLRGITENGKILVNDPNDNSNKNFVNKSFDMSLILRESKNFWSFSN